MSNSLVRKGLELLGYEKETKRGTRKRKNVKYKGTLELIAAKHRIVTSQDKTETRNKHSVHEAKKKKAAEKDPTDETIRKLLLLSKNSIDSDTSAKLFDRAVQKKYISKKQKPKEPETTAFTEEDFKKFEQEYIEQ